MTGRAGALALAAAVWLAAAPAARAARPGPDFSTGVLPLITKAGCNTGACHGAAIGRGGFRLSLLGFDPESDYESITREFGGRRLQLSAPDESLLLRKPTMAVPHGGGLRFRADSPLYRGLREWIAAGAGYGPGTVRVTALEAAPADALLPAPGAAQQLRVTALLSDGSRRDVTRLALYTSNDDGLAEVDEGGRVTMKGRGQASVMVRYLGQVAAARLAVPYPAARAPAALPAPDNVVDREVFRELGRLRIEPSPPVGDAQFLRRAYLDVIGVLPTPDEVRRHLERRAAGGDPRPERERVVDALLGRPEFTDLWTLRWADTLLINSRRLGPEPAKAYHEWLRSQVAANVPFDRWAAALVTASGDPRESGAANFLRTATDPRDLAEFVSRTFLGVRVQCARCHAHPFDRWTQADYYGFAAFFARLRYDGGQVTDAAAGDLEHPKSGLPVPPKLLEATSPAALPAGGRRAALAAWLASNENARLAEAAVNRVWKHLMGRGIVEPVDDLRPTNPAANPGLLRALAGEFTRGGYDLRRLVRTIVLSRAYQLSSRSNETNRSDDRLFSRAYLRPLAAHVLADAIAQATGVPLAFPDQPEGTRAVQLADALAPSEALDVFGRCRRDGSCDEEAASGGLPQALHLINGPTINERLRTGVLARLFREGATDAALVEELYLRTLSRPPEARETAYWERALRDAPDRRAAAEDLLWALLNAREFAYNH